MNYLALYHLSPTFILANFGECRVPRLKWSIIYAAIIICVQRFKNAVGMGIESLSFSLICHKKIENLTSYKFPFYATTEPYKERLTSVMD